MILEQKWPKTEKSSWQCSHKIVHGSSVLRVVIHILELFKLYELWPACNLVPRSLVDEAEGEIWQSKKICFSWLAAPFDSCPIPSLTRFFRGKLSSNSSSRLEISAVGVNEKPIRKDERRKDLEVICHSGLNNFCNMIVPLPKSQTRHPARAQAPISQTCFLTQNFTNPSPCSLFFVLTRSPNLRTKTACGELIPEAF